MRIYRIGNYFYRKKIPVLPLICDGLTRLLMNCVVYSSSSIGKGTSLAYGGIAVVIHKNAVIGNNCIIGANVTIGGKAGSLNVPRIGDNVNISTGAKVLGDIRIGSNSVIGANAVVISDVPENCVVAGMPAKVIKENIEPKDYL